jgi:hypothetical protein
MSNINLNPPPPATSSTNTYTPGHPKRKLMMIAYGIVLFSFGFSQIWTPLCLVAIGKRAKAEASVVIKTKSGVHEEILTDDGQIQVKLEPHDRSFVFWNEFRFHTDNGQIVEVRAPIGSQLKPLYMLTDQDGLPTTDVVYYNPDDPRKVVFPLIVSTWFASGVLLIAGLVCVIIGGTLYYWSNKPIELPHLPPSI